MQSADRLIMDDTVAPVQLATRYTAPLSLSKILPQTAMEVI